LRVKVRVNVCGRMMAIVTQVERIRVKEMVWVIAEGTVRESGMRRVSLNICVRVRAILSIKVRVTQ
jgi:hypothetical protein